MWEQPAVYAVHNNDNKRATKLFENVESAIEWIKERPSKTSLKMEKRLGERRRCEKYCSAKEFCSQYKAYKESLA
jgi:hypothetical protein